MSAIPMPTGTYCKHNSPTKNSSIFGRTEISEDSSFGRLQYFGAIASRFRNAARIRFEAGAGRVFHIGPVDGVSGSHSSSLGISPDFRLPGSWKLLPWHEPGIAGVGADCLGAIAVQGHFAGAGARLRRRCGRVDVVGPGPTSSAGLVPSLRVLLVGDGGRAVEHRG